MQVRLLCDRCGHYGLQTSGEIVDLPETEARGLVAHGQAEWPVPETASVAPAECAAKPRPAARKRN
jgi:hypothetical protein